MDDFNVIAIDTYIDPSFGGIDKSICTIGLCCVKNGKITTKKKWDVGCLYQTEKDFEIESNKLDSEITEFVKKYKGTDRYNNLLTTLKEITNSPHKYFEINHEKYSTSIKIKGFTSNNTERKTPEIWPEILPYLENQNILCYNTSVTMYSLKRVLDYYNIPYPNIKFYGIRELGILLFKDCERRRQMEALRESRHPILSNFQEAYEKVEPLALLAIDCLSEYYGHLSELNPYDGFVQGYMHGKVFKHQTGYGSETYSEFTKNIQENNVTIDTDYTTDYFNGKSVCFTGIISCFPCRKDLLVLINTLGGMPTNSVTRKTDILIVGGDFEGEGYQSSKYKKAKELIAKGYNIEIMSEEDFKRRLAA